MCVNVYISMHECVVVCMCVAASVFVCDYVSRPYKEQNKMDCSAKKKPKKKKNPKKLKNNISFFFFIDPRKKAYFDLAKLTLKKKSSFNILQTNKRLLTGIILELPAPFLV